jgi:uncharacterized protein YjiS (DUF1127 family)
MKRLNIGFGSSRERRHPQRVLTKLLAQWRIRARSRRQLLELDDRMLNDIGLTRHEILHGKQRVKTVVSRCS